uniref:Uncharacterized protein n=1 Tax=Arundo donax TaxID=35708 RepID=A0A0A9H2U3_ARUDO
MSSISGPPYTDNRLLEARSWLVFKIIELPPTDLVRLVILVELHHF